MGRFSQADYQSQLTALLPVGHAWRRDPQAFLVQLLAAFAEEYARFDTEIDFVLQEAFPDTAIVRLYEWERALGLPECTDVDQSLAMRRAQVLIKLTESKSATPAHIEEVAARLGFIVTLDERFDEVYTCESECEDPIYEDEIRLSIIVRAPEVTIVEFTCETPCEEALRSWGNDLLECVIGRLVPAHAQILFAYGG